MADTVRDLLTSGVPSFSFEFMPPRSDDEEGVLWKAIHRLEPLRPAFVDITYGAGGSRRDRTLRTVERVVATTGLTVVAHLTCVGATREELQEIIGRLADAGVRNVLALRGDPPAGPDAPWERCGGGLDSAEDLVRLLHQEGEFCVGVAAYPGGHWQSGDAAADVAHFVRKVRAGADFALTQFFYDPADYTRFVDAVRAADCDVPIVPGIMPVTSLGQISRFPRLSGQPFPEDLAARLRAAGEVPEAVRAIGVEVATQLAVGLLDAGAPGIHYYTLNRSTATREIHDNLTRLGLAPTR